MTGLPQKYPSLRAPRVTLPECLFVTLELENGRKIPAKLQRVSVTGGLLDLAFYVEERVPVTLNLPIGSGVVHGRAELLFPMRSATGYLQPFRFTALSTEQKDILAREISELLQKTQASSGPRHELGVRIPNFLLDLQ